VREETRIEIRAILTDFSRSQAAKMRHLTAEAIRAGYPFHRLLFDDNAIMAARIERSVVTSMGQSLFKRLASAVARDQHRDVRTEHDFQGTLNDAACNMIDQIVTELRTAQRARTYDRKPNHERERNEVLGSSGGGLSQRSIRADLYVGDFAEGPLFIELKTPKPNLDMAAESKRKLLYYLAMQSKNGIDALGFVGLTYNPFGTR